MNCLQRLPDCLRLYVLVGASHTLLVSHLILPPLMGDNLICLPFSLVCPVTLLRLSACNIPVQPSENHLIYYLFSFNGRTLKSLDFTGFLKNFSTKKVLNLLCCHRIHYTVISRNSTSSNTCHFCKFFVSMIFIFLDSSPFGEQSTFPVYLLP